MKLTKRIIDGLDRCKVISIGSVGVDTIDVYYLHNTEGQIAEVGRETFEQRLRDAFSLLESKVAEGKIVRYGLATWNGFRSEPGSKDYLPLERITRIAGGGATAECGKYREGANQQPAPDEVKHVLPLDCCVAASAIFFHYNNHLPN